MVAPTHKAVDHTLQKEIVSALTGNVSADVVDYFGEDQGFPVVVVGDMFGEDLSSNTTSGERIRARLTIISEARGAKEAQQIKSEVMQQLDRTLFDLGDDFKHVHHKYLRSNPRRRVSEGDNHVMLRYIDMDFEHLVTVL